MGQHLPPIMVLLSSSVRQSNAQPLKLQALEGWQALVKALAKEAPHQLADVADQVLQRPEHNHPDQHPLRIPSRTRMLMHSETVSQREWH